jgi:hypothetical protein
MGVKRIRYKHWPNRAGGESTCELKQDTGLSDFQLAKLYSISKSVLMFPEAPKSPSSYYQAQQISLECIP